MALDLVRVQQQERPQGPAAWWPSAVVRQKTSFFGGGRRHKLEVNLPDWSLSSSVTGMNVGPPPLQPNTVAYADASSNPQQQNHPEVLGCFPARSAGCLSSSQGRPLTPCLPLLRLLLLLLPANLRSDCSRCGERRKQHLQEPNAVSLSWRGTEHVFLSPSSSNQSRVCTSPQQVSHR